MKVLPTKTRFHSTYKITPFSLCPNQQQSVHFNPSRHTAPNPSSIIKKLLPNPTLCEVTTQSLTTLLFEAKFKNVVLKCAEAHSVFSASIMTK